MRSVNLSPKDWKVISALKPGLMVADIAQQTRMSEDEVGEIVTRLMDEGLVEVAGAPESAPATAEPTPLPSPVADEEYSVAAVHDAHAAEEPEPVMAGTEPKQGVVQRFLSRFGRG
jgi:DNA-binding Lrp family transcriptional regulator